MTINNAAGVTLSAPVTLDSALVLTSGILSTGAHAITADMVSGGSQSAYVNTAGGGSLSMNNVGGTEKLFPLGTDNYAPLWITNSGVVDTFTVGVIPDAVSEPGHGRVELKWTIAEAVAGGTVGRLKFGWMGSSENSTFSGDRAAFARIVRVGADTVEVGKGAYQAQFSSEPYSVARDSITTFSSFIIGTMGPVSSAEPTGDAIPTEFAVDQNYPNPFNPTTSIRYHLPEATLVTIRLFDVLGREVGLLLNEEHEAGSYTTQWNAAGFSSGMYYCSVMAGDDVKIIKLVLLK